MHAHTKAGWTYSAFNGQAGGWELATNDGLARIVARRPKARKWEGFVVRQADGRTLFSNEYPTRDAAMQAVALQAV